jgi:hypothetical protein
MDIKVCKCCVNHVLYENGYVICDYSYHMSHNWNLPEQRVTGKGADDGIYVINCPKDNHKSLKRFKYGFIPMRMNEYLNNITEKGGKNEVKK